MDMLPIVTACKSTSSAPHSPSLGDVARSVFSFTGDVVPWGFHWQTLVPASGTQNKQESSLRGNPSHRVQTSVRFVPKNPFVAVTFIAKFPKLPAKRLCPLEPRIRWYGGIISVVSFVDSSSSMAHFCKVSVSSSSQFPTLFPLGADFGWSSIDVSFWLCNLLECDQCVHSGNILCQFYPSLLLCLCLDQDEI